MLSKKERPHIWARRIKEFWKEYRRNKLGLIGLGLLLIFAIMAFGAPYLTPYDPLHSTNLAGSRAKPIWMTFFVGYQKLSRNIQPIKDPGFNSQESLKNWQIADQTTAISVSYSGDVGNPSGSGLGSVLVKFSRENKGFTYGKLSKNLELAFDNPYEPPQRFTADLSWKAVVSGSASCRIGVLIRDPKGALYSLWDSPVIASASDEWSTPSPRIDSWTPQIRLRITDDLLGSAEKAIFSSEGKYALVVRTTFTDENASDTPKIEIYLDDVNFRTYGDAFGLLGTDQFGADLFSQLVYGARLSLIIGILAATLSVFIGTVVGLVAGYFGGTLDEVLMRFNDMLLVLPGLPLLLILIAVLGPTIWNLVILIGLLGFMGVARIIRSQVLSLRERAFIEAARAVGAGSYRIMFRHILPNVMSLAFAQLALFAPAAITTEAALSWLGLGDPTVPTWGRMLFLAHYYGVLKEWWWIVFPGLSIALISVAFIFIGHAMDEILNPRLRRK